jgi:hypothetical protein
MDSRGHEAVGVNLREAVQQNDSIRPSRGQYGGSLSRRKSAATLGRNPRRGGEFRASVAVD